MAPVPFRGKVAEPSMVPHIAEIIATVKKSTVEDVFEVCRENTREVYGI
jgi:TatD DNase family protein